MISICILNMNRVETLKKTFEVLKSLNIEHEILVWDQNSNDGSVEFLKLHPIVKLYCSSKNVGNSISRNKMIRDSKYDYILLLDSDIVPIKNSIECLYKFMMNNIEYSFIGYDYNNHSTNIDEITPFEFGINVDDVKTGVRIALTQYGLFRKKDLLLCPFPEFYPFNQEGWGAEDDMIGMAINDGGVGLTGMVKGRMYYHNHSKSSWNHINDEVHRLYALRYIIYKYFSLFLSADQKIQTLQSNEIPSTYLDLTKYHWEIGNNFGDVATDWVWNKYFPFFKLKQNSKNLLFFGGSIIEHLDNARNKFNIDFRNLYMFGVGVYSPFFTLPDIKFEIYPRGYETERLIKNRGFETNNVVGDVLQLLSLLPYRESKKSNTLLIQDVFFNAIPITEYGNKIRVADVVPSYEESAEYVNMIDFLDKVVEYDSVISSQIHPFYYYVASGKSSKLIHKQIRTGVMDVRPNDLLFIKNLEFESDEYSSMHCRLEMQKNIPQMIDNLFNLLKDFS